MKSTELTAILVAVLFSAAAQSSAPVVASLGACTSGLKAPARVAISPSGRIYVSDPQTGEVAVFDSSLRKVAVREGLARPLGLAVDAQERIFVAQELTGSVSVFGADWKLLYKLGTGDGEFRLPNYIALAFGTSEPKVYVSDSRANQIKVFIGGTLVTQFGAPGAGNGEFDFPAGLCVSAGEVFVVDQNNDRVQVFDAEGRFLRAFPLGTSGATPSGRAQGAFIDNKTRLYVADTFQGAVKVFDALSGTLLSNLGGFGRMPGQLSSPAGLALDTFNRLFVSSAGTRRVEVYGIDSFLHVALDPAADVFASGSNLLLKAVTGGEGPFAYQWRKDGVNINGATHDSYTLPTLNPADAGAYSVVVTGPSGVLASGATQVQVFAPPRILSSPESLTAVIGINVTLQVAASGANLCYQWQLNGVTLEGESNSALLLANVQAHQAGIYKVIVSNAVGVATSSPALLTVLAPPTTVEILSASVATDSFFHLILNADPGFRYALDASEDLFGWMALTDFSNDAGLFEFVDTTSTNSVNRFYRIRWLP